jgi:hypothetical protein
MPRRRALAGAQLAGLLALPTAEADLIRHWTLDRTDLTAVDRRRGDHNRLGFGVPHCTLTPVPAPAATPRKRRGRPRRSATRA